MFHKKFLYLLLLASAIPAIAKKEHDRDDDHDKNCKVFLQGAFTTRGAATFPLTAAGSPLPIDTVALAKRVRISGPDSTEVIVEAHGLYYINAAIQFGTFVAAVNNLIFVELWLEVLRDGSTVWEQIPNARSRFEDFGIPDDAQSVLFDQLTVASLVKLESCDRVRVLARSTTTNGEELGIISLISLTDQQNNNSPAMRISLWRIPF